MLAILKKNFAGLFAVGLAVGMSATLVVPAAQAADMDYERLSGPTGVETSLEVAKHTWGTNWPVVYVASNRNPVDALPAATIGDGPIVLTDGKNLYLGGVKPGHIVILGGKGAVPDTIEQQARKISGAENVERLAGVDRNGTARMIAERWLTVNGPTNRMYLSHNAGSGSPDAVAGSVLRDGPILTYTNADSIEDVKAFVTMRMPLDQPGGAKLVALGGPGAVPDAVLKTVANGADTSRFAGANRYLTAYEIAKYAAADPARNVAYVASGTGLKDAMVAGASRDGFILLTPANGAGTFQQAQELGATKMVFIGGEGVLPPTTLAQAAGIVPIENATTNTSITGTVRILNTEELLQLETRTVDSLTLEAVGNNTYAVLVLDSAETFQIPYAAGEMTDSREASLIGLGDSTAPGTLDQWLPLENQRVTVIFPPKTMFWPTDVSLPLAGPHSFNAYPS